jgi:hypothetical protein
VERKIKIRIAINLLISTGRLFGFLLWRWFRSGGCGAGGCGRFLAEVDGDGFPVVGSDLTRVSADGLAHDDIFEADGFAIAADSRFGSDLEGLGFCAVEHDGLRGFVDGLDRAVEGSAFCGRLFGFLFRALQTECEEKRGRKQADKMFHSMKSIFVVGV